MVLLILVGGVKNHLKTAKGPRGSVFQLQKIHIYASASSTVSPLEVLWRYPWGPCGVPQGPLARDDDYLANGPFKMIQPDSAN